MTKQPIMSAFAAFLVAALTFSFAFVVLLVVVKLAEEPEKAGEGLVQVGGLDEFASGPGLRATLFYPDEAKFTEWRDGECLVRHPDVVYQRLRAFLEPYKACATAEEKVRVLVSGYASSSLGGGWSEEDFDVECKRHRERWRKCLSAQGCTADGQPESGRQSCVGEAFNLCLANERARHVVSEIEGGREGLGEWFAVSAKEWKNYRDMAEAPLIDDRTHRGYDPVRGLLNRRVQFEVKDAGRCVVAVSRDEEGGESESGVQVSARRFLGALDDRLLR